MLQVLILFCVNSKEDDSPYWKGRAWACNEYYNKGRSIEELRTRVTRKLKPDDFERGALDALNILKERHGK